jgi:uncharacterized iron-regulated protein
MRAFFLALTLLLTTLSAATELDVLPLGDADRATDLGAAAAGSFFDTVAAEPVAFELMVERLARADVVLIGEEHTAMDQKIFHARLLDALADTGRALVLGMEFFHRGDADALERWLEGEIDDRMLLEATGWYERGGYRWEYYSAVMDVARRRGIPVVGVNVPREIPRTVNREGLESLTEEQRAEVGDVSTEGSPQHRYLISRYFGDTVAMLPPGWFENMYAAQCLWDVVMARSLLEVAAVETTVVLIVGSGHVAYDLGIPRRLDDERIAAGLPKLDVVTLCPATAPAPRDDDEPTGHPMGGGGHGMGAPPASPAQFSRSLADYVAVFPDHGGIEAFPTLGLRLKAGDDDRPVVSMVWPDTLASAVGFASGDVILDVNGIAPDNLAALRFLLAEIEWGQRLGVLLQRGEKTVEIGALLFPDADTSDRSVAPGFSLQEMRAVEPASASLVVESVLPDDRPHWKLISTDGVPVRVELRSGEVLEQVHELDVGGRIGRSLYRVAREDGAVEIRYDRDSEGQVVATERVDRTGSVIE